MIDKKSNILVVTGLTLVFTLFYAYSFFGIGVFAGSNFGENLVEKTLDGDVDVIIRGKAGHIMDLMSIIGETDALELPEGSEILEDMLNRVYVNGKYNYKGDSKTHSVDIALTDETYGLEMMNIELFYADKRMYFKVNPLLETAYYYDSQVSEEKADNDVSFFDDMFEESDGDVSFVRRTGFDGKSTYQYEYNTILMLTDARYVDLSIYLKPDGSVSEVVIGKEDETLNLYFVESDFELDVEDFGDAQVYDANTLNNDLIDYADDILE